MGKKARLKKLRKEAHEGGEPSPAANRISLSGNLKNDIFDNRIFFTVILSLVFLSGILLRINYVNVADYRGGADEGFYLRYGAYMATEKGASLRALTDEYMRNAEWQMYPNPLRAGYILLSGWWMKALHRPDFAALSLMSCFFSILPLFLGYWFVRRLFYKRVALLALILLVSSPLALAMGRRALQDSVAVFFIIASLYLFYEAFNARKGAYIALFNIFQTYLHNV